MALLLVLEGPNSGRTYYVTGLFTIGTDASNSIVLDDRRIAPEQLRLQRDGARFVVKNLDQSREVLLNGERLAGEAELRHGDMLDLADARLLFSDEEAPSTASSPDVTQASSPAAALPAGPRIERRQRAFENAAEVISAAGSLDKPYARLATLYKVSHATSSVLDPEALMRSLLELILEEIPADRALVLLMDEERSEMLPSVCRVRDGVEAPPGMTVSRTILSEVCRTREAVATTDALADPRFAGGESVARQRIRSAVCVPLISRNKLLGVIHLDIVASDKRAFTEGDLDLLTGIALQAGIALENARSYHRAQRYSRNLASLQRAMLWLGSYLERDPILKETVSFVCSNLKCTKASVLLLDAVGRFATIGHATGIDRKLWPEIQVVPGRGLAGRVLSTREPILSPDPATGRPPESAEYTRKGKYLTDSFVIVPIPRRSESQPHEDKPMGVINAADKLGGRNFTNEDLEILNLLASQVGMALVNASLYERATVDQLTRLYTRPFFFQKGEVEVERAERQGAPLAVLMVDLDHFKAVNDTHGHAAGDQALRILGSIIKESLRDDDIACRMGGEEFAAILPGGSLEGVQLVAERVRKTVESFPLDADGKPIRLTISLGIALYRAGDKIDKMLARADAALYRAKRAGRNRVEMES
ncbi:MAG: diguanylate cyclase [Planctomycetes bacterium]|nr:diguanylate cyclase [Planctomycetota bacterium]